MYKRIWGIISCLWLVAVNPIQAVENFVSADDIKIQLDALKSNTNDEMTLLAKNLEGALSFIEKTKKQQADIENLEKKIKDAPNTLAKYQTSIQQLKEELESSVNNFTALSNEAVENRQDTIHQQLQDNQTKLNEVSSSLASYRSALDFTRKQISENNAQAEKLNRWKYNSQASKSLIDKYNAELKYIEVNNRYNLILGQNIDLLISIDESRKTEINLKQQLLQKQLSFLQEVLNANRLKEYQAQAKQAEELKANNKIENPIIQEELTLNTDLSQYLVEQTQKVNRLSQDNLRAKNVLDALTHTKRNIEEQISALQGTLVLSRVINQQKQSLPTDSVIKGLAKDIATLRVELFDITQ
ncbi:mechanosensitive channel MscK, partial [Ursidibacter arcticus]